MPPRSAVNPCSNYQGLTRSAISDRHPEYDADGSPLALPSVPGGESLSEPGERVVTGRESLLADPGADEAAAVVTHGGPIRAVISAVTGRDIRTLAREFSPDNCGFSVFEGSPGGIDPVTRDDCTHLAGSGEWERERGASRSDAGARTVGQASSAEG